MLSRAIFLLLLAIPTAAARANTWTCVALGDLSGDPLFYYSHYRDAWAGQGRIECTAGRRILRLETQVRYQGTNIGIGASQNSRIGFESMPIVTRSPRSLAQKMAISQNGEILDLWIASGSSVNLNILLFGDQLDRFSGSIADGDLSIQLLPNPPFRADHD